MISSTQKWWNSQPVQLSLLLLLVAIVFLPCLQGGFLADDHWLVQDRKQVYETPGSLLDLTRHVYWWNTNTSNSRQELYRPWSSFTLWLNYQMGGLSPFGYHFANYLVHLAVVLLLYFLIAPLTGLGWAFVISALMGVSPGALTSVGWISGRTDLWAVFFSLIFLITFRSARSSRKIWPLLGALISFFLALASKEVAIIAPVIAWLLSYVESNTEKSLEQASPIKQPAWHYLSLSIPLIVYFVLRKAALGALISSAGISGAFGRSFPYLAERILRSAQHILFPVNYSFFYEILWSKPESRGLGFFLGWIVFIALIALIIYGLRKRQLWAIGGLWFGMPLFLVYGLAQSFAAIAEFYAYFAIPGLLIFAVDGLRHILPKLSIEEERLKRILPYFATVVIVIYGILTFSRLPYLKSDQSLSIQNVEVESTSILALTKLADIYYSQNDTTRSMQLINRAIQLDPRAWEPQKRMAVFYLDRSDIQGASSYVDALAELAPDKMEAQATIARFYYQAGHCAEALTTYRQAFSLGEPTAEIMFDCGLALICADMNDAAVEVFERALSIRPEWPEAYHNLGVSLEKLGQNDRAISAYLKAIKLDPKSSTWESLSLLYAKIGKRAEAVHAAQSYLSTNPPDDKIIRFKDDLSKAGVDASGL